MAWLAAPVILNELATQHDPAFIRTYLVLSSEGLLQYQKLRPVDQLTQILRSSAHREENRALQQFFQHFNHAEACSMCLCVVWLEGVLGTVRAADSHSCA